LDLRGWKWGGGRRLHNEKLRNLYASPNIVRVIKSKRMRWEGHEARMERYICRSLVAKREWKRALGRLGCFIVSL